MKKLISPVVLLSLLVTPLLSWGAQEFESLVKGYASVRTIKGRIVQYIYTGPSVEKLEGDYSAGEDGSFRIDYSYPEKQTVIKNSSGLYWYYPERRLVFLSNKKELYGGAAGLLPGNSIGESLKNVQLTYEGVRFYSLLGYAHVYSLSADKKGNSVRIWVDSSGKFVRRRYVVDPEGYEILKEVYHEHVKAGGAYIPSKIELFIRGSGGVVHTLTEYSSLSVNGFVDRKQFEFSVPKNVDVRGFDEI